MYRSMFHPTLLIQGSIYSRLAGKLAIIIEDDLGRFCLLVFVLREHVTVQS